MKKILLMLILFTILINPVKIYASVTSADAYIIMDEDTKRVIQSKDMNEVRLIASITKIMTCILAIESNRLDDIVVVNDSIAKSYGSGVYIEIGEEITLRDLLYGLMLRSGNDAAMMIASYVSGSEEEFVIKMNNKAKELGMKNTSFKNSSGLDTSTSGNYSSSYDMALLSSYAMKYEEYQNIVKTKKYTVKTNYKTYIWNNKNKLLAKDYIIGGKTGFTERANRTLVTNGYKDNMHFTVVTLNDSDDWNTHTKLYEYAFNNYKSYKVLDKNTFEVEEDTYYKDKLYIKEDIYLTLTTKEATSITSNVKLEKLKTYKNGTTVGYNYLMLDNKELKKVPIYIEKKEEVKKRTSWFKKFIDWIIFW